ncbi:Mitochodrial transcription termination factor-related protein [Corchorus olitorius]|uniref:Mitochodrial transcription termination factor-related protein n=1 Tax=Corchorus olitorius TaxID=93759 RepID=A0A1R3GZZ5_9ROSI|nr:Mitochodrial transcription termination factor-related protein [Corchorus olitorius]
MFSKAHYLLQLRFLVSASNSQFCTDAASKVATTCSTICPNEAEILRETGTESPRNSSEVFKKWGCTENDLLNIFSRRPSLRNAQVTPLSSKLELLSCLGITTSDLVKMINRRPHLLRTRINKCFHERLEFFRTLFGSGEVLRKAIVKDPSLLTYDLHNRIKPVIASYEEMGVSGNDLRAMLMSRPTLIPRTSFNEEKMEFIKKIGVSKGSKMYKYVVVLIGISRIETIQEKVANLEKFGCSEDEVWSLLGRSPFILTLSVDKVQRNMIFVVATMKLSPKVVLQRPHLLFSNLETVLKPRFLLAGKLREMELQPQITRSDMLRAFRMKEERFLTSFVRCHPENVATELLEFYKIAKCMKRLAQASKIVSSVPVPVSVNVRLKNLEPKSRYESSPLSGIIAMLSCPLLSGADEIGLLLRYAFRRGGGTVEAHRSLTVSNHQKLKEMGCTEERKGGEDDEGDIERQLGVRQGWQVL